MRKIGRYLDRVLRKIKKAFLASVAWFERSAKKATRGLRFQKRIAKAEKIVSGRGGKILKPIRKNVLHQLSTTETGLARIRKSKSFKAFSKATYWLWYPWVATFAFLKTFWSTRRRATAIAATTVLITAISLLLSTRFLNVSRAGLTDKYRRAMIAEMAKGNSEHAAIYKTKLLNLGLRERDFEMNQIHYMVNSGQIEQAIAYAESLAPLDRPGFVDAHFWLAQQLLNGQTALQPDDALRNAETHIKNLRTALNKPGFPSVKMPREVTFVAAEIERRKGNYNQHIELLQSIPEFFPAAQRLMEHYLKSNNSALALKHALLLNEEIENHPEAVNNMSESVFATWCTALTAAGESPELVNALTLWQQRFPNNEFIREEVASIRLLQIETLLSRGSSSDSLKAAEILNQTIKGLPSSSHEMVSHWATLRMLPKGKHPSFEKMVELAIADPDAPSMLLEIAGTARAWEQDYEQARELFLRAVESDSLNALAWNALALMELHFDRLDEAMRCADHAVKYGENNVVFLRTRGLISVRMKLWDKAVEDLRRVIALQPDSKSDHELLSQAYLAKGNQALAEMHQSMGKQ